MPCEKEEANRIWFGVGMLTSGLPELMQRAGLPVGWKHWTIQTLRRNALRLVEKRPAAHLEVADLLPTATAAPDGAAPDLPVGLTGAGPAGTWRKNEILNSVDEIPIPQDESTCDTV